MPRFSELPAAFHFIFFRHFGFFRRQFHFHFDTPAIAA
jgi:hypothetical protein